MTHDPILLATWTFGLAAIESAWPALAAPGGGALDAAVAAALHAEDDLANPSVGVGGLPDRDGTVSLDAAVIVSPAFRGAVCDVRAFPNPVLIARRVAERTPHTLLSGRGAEAFARAEGFAPAELLTPDSRRLWEAWRDRRDAAPDAPADAAGLPVANFEENPKSAAAAGDPNAAHDTIGVLARDAAGTLAATCSTSGMPWKRPGRVGDSPVVGHGLYCDPAAGAAVCTGHGELVSAVCGAFLAVDTLRRGGSPQAAADAVIDRVLASFSLTDRDQIGVIVLAPDGTHAAASLRPGFQYAVRDPRRAELLTPGRIALPG